MGHFSPWLALAGAMLLGCGSQLTAQPGKPPPRTQQPQTEAAPTAVEQPPDLIAPPPAYGNKVVMARALGPRAAQ